MTTIYKYYFDETISMPKGAEVLHVDFQRNGIYLWCRVSINEKTLVDRHFRMYYTGDYIPDARLQHISTLQYNDMVYHIFEKLNEN
jgi:hypothetical protein